MHLRLKRTLLGSIAGLAVVLSFQNCSSEHVAGNAPGGSSMPSVGGAGAPPPRMSDADFARLQADARRVLTNRCASCHDGSARSVGPVDILNFSQLVAQNFIRPGQPQNSPVYLNVIDGLMPKGFNMVANANQEVIILRDWILNYR